ncbi:hypothetical protein EW093_07225 [Thiospirochaeta perfilievii]|uniref:Uncharacterized protein n=1 Tax=Thiospirochaeta perfilievii TaxID=252967 RepID=A0A5C1QC62_9SPIO|nr:hypothetical protein [Thiospirochaeta perfilievii]QEN04499.1 hypothetical protein EW093_07225 [Thiospirochaeta perfilievii]
MSDLDDILGLPSKGSNNNDSPVDLNINPSFNDLFEDEIVDGNEVVDREEFEEITVFKTKPVKNLYDEKYYKRALQGEGEIAQKLHSSLAKFLKAKDPQDKTMFRNRLQPVYWDFIEALSQKVGNALSLEKKFLLRYALLLPTLVNRDQLENLSVIIQDNIHGEPVHYFDEWLEMVTLGDVNPLGSDEEPIKNKKSRGTSGLRMQKDKFSGALDSRLGSLKILQKKRSSAEKSIIDNVRELANHTQHPVFPSIEMGYTVLQKTALTDLINSTKELQRLDREYTLGIQEAKLAQSKLDKVVERMNDEPTEVVNPAIIKKEVNNLRQIHKMCVGRQGNHFPILHGSYITSNFNDIATREQILKVMKYVEDIDPGVFRRTHRRETHRIVPHIIIIPCYGDKGICWEPFEKYNRASSRGRVAVPLYPKDIKLAVITALADLRWEVAKAKAQYYWMEEGITGKYFQWFEERKLKGDVKLRFIEDYILWITKESVGTQKLEKDVRGIFWRNIPFPKELREHLRNRGFVYSELYKKDTNRELSDGY